MTLAKNEREREHRRADRIAVVNWRDPWHPAAGGAERYAWELARRFAAEGRRVHYVTSRAPGQARRETVEGVIVVRLGGRFTVYPLVLAWMLTRRRSFDAVLDCQNGIPFFTPWVLPRGVPVLCVVHHVHDEQFGVHFSSWLARVGRLLEGPVARRAYRRHACVAVSPSTVTAMRERLSWTGPVYVVPNGVTPPPAVPAGEGTGLVCVSRLVPHKRIGKLFDLAERLRVPLRIVGRGPEEDALRAEVATRNLGDLVLLAGYLPEDDKTALVARARLHLSTSRGEGWGLSVTEAAALGVPTVAFDVDGLRDAVRDGVTGWLVPTWESFEDTVELALKELSDPHRREEMADACRDWAAQFDWARSADRMAALVDAAVRRGTAYCTRPEAVVIGGKGPERVVEGPVRDELLETRGIDSVRPATDVERLLGWAGGWPR
ncbi:glycosyltransferase family 4 protein [Actinoallomurus bryophytorum]|uniref:Glycosyltransferase involved in cell wall biosynthesis n=1 Tax=Actinoallomurus bryophytorum TaxID=1490222 RepID=A0A543CN31_9ACTN|nr:glycosyltransferase family 4 protein [Actinoallomurus bryophytorum]TQL98493.1 glycosyltransferase involved in cell wall biosynthesis [Actinoallomurus bryophytorum]